MKKLMVFVLALVCVSFLFGCNKGAENTNVPFETDMTKKLTTVPPRMDLRVNHITI
jgi:hypothetical protein